MLERLVAFAVKRWLLVLGVTLIVAIYGWRCFRALPVEAFPDVTDPMVEVVGIYPGQAAEEVEQRVTIELERSLAGTPGLIDLRSVSVFGLSLVTLTFNEQYSSFQLRAMVSERLAQVDLPESASVEMGPEATPVGQIYRYTLRGPRSLRELRSLQQFTIEPRLRAVPGVADVVTFGGYERRYVVRVDPDRLAAYGVSAVEIHDALARSNRNAGGGYVGVGGQEFVVRGLGVATTPEQLGLAVVRELEGVPVRVMDVADIVEGSTPRRGAVGLDRVDDVVEGIVFLRRGENPSEVLDALRARIDQLNREVLPGEVEIVPFYDRQELVDATLETVGKNLAEGLLLVLLVVYLFLRNGRAVLIVAIVIPLSMLSAFIGLHAMGLSANLISLGAIDFGILVDGAVIVIEATLHALPEPRAPGVKREQVLRRTVVGVARPVFFSLLIIMVALTPIFTLERVEGRIFAPMAFTYGFALLGALVAALVVVPALESALMSDPVESREPRWLAVLGRGYVRALRAANRRRLTVLAILPLATLALIGAARDIGSEFLPELNEGGFYITSVFPSTISLDETGGHVSEARERILTVPEVRGVLSHIGRPEDATQAEGPNNAELFVKLARERDWRPGVDRKVLEDEIRAALAPIPGVQHNFSQPITDRVFETISGIIGQVVVKVHGDDLEQLTQTAEEIRAALAEVEGVTDLALYQAGSIPQLRIDIDREELARRGLTIDDVQTTVSIALGGAVATELWKGSQRYSVALALPQGVRADPEALARLTVAQTDGPPIQLGEVAKLSTPLGRTSIWREDFSRFVAVKFNVRGRDLGGTVAEVRETLEQLPMPEGVYPSLSGEFENKDRALKRLAITFPVAMLAICGLLFANFGRARPVLCLVAFLPIALAGAVAGLHASGENFSVSGAVGCIALLGQLVLAGVIICAAIDRRAAAGVGPERAMLEGARAAFRPVLLTCSLALLGLVPAALAHGMGSETQRPFAIAIVAGLLTVTPALMLLLPLLYGGGRPSTPADSTTPSEA
ncbi:Cobalt-zinc-cadmium resistance protein CzcA [Enhygromyxa salina]|uniref:Cobalt-zinc-cadmium resistance protein CzcA n=1 Tax=Enhygromyxa salina TaxID=215803 RepID=A0A2S9XE60_9BACT|nr:CusA/CzcA family heavy metal efflux RND transporter [Enhygromyxa salina]PRP91143.1 Cobalt-zinc-cadmium resistance protein CzcA [Enhygromyxa salina]